MTARRVALGALAGGLLLASCSRFNVEEIPGVSAGTRVTRITGARQADTPPDPGTANLTRSDLESSLRRIVVRYYGFTRWNKSDPRPLLSERQIAEFAAVLADELPRLRENQRLNFEFSDRKMGGGYRVSMNAYREGIYIVYRFDALVTSTATGAILGEAPRFDAELQALAGQVVLNLDGDSYVKDPVLGDERVAAAEREAKSALLEAALAESVADESEKARLEPLILRSAPSLESWKTYWDKRRTLKKAFEQNLMDRAAFQAQVERLTAELER